MHALLIQWSDSILDIPTLVQLGYGCVTIPVAGNSGVNVASLDREEDESQDVGEGQALLTQSQNHLEENQQQAVQKVPPIDDSFHANNNDDYSEDQPLMETQSQNHLENRQQAVQDDDLSHDEDPDDANEQEGSGGGGLARATERDREKPRDPTGKEGDRHEQRGYVPSAELLLESTDVVFNEITDPDTVTVTDIHTSLCKRYGFKLGKAERVLVEKRLTELMNATNNSSTTRRDSTAVTEHALDSYTTTANILFSTRHSMSSDDSDSEHQQYPPRLSFRASDHTASARPSNPRSSKRADGEEAADLETTDEDRPSRRQKRPLDVIDVENKRRATPKESRASDKRDQVHVNLWSDSDASVSSACSGVVLKRDTFAKPTTRDHTNRKTGPWSEEEVEAFRKGVARFGIGKWLEIRDHSDGHLFGRTGVQIKDKYRQMTRAGKL
jgi:hypothetical protein